MKRINFLISFSIISLICIFCLSNVTKVYADDDISELAGFSLKLDYPENQIDPSLGYFSLKVNPGGKQKVTIQLTNSSDKNPTTVEVQTNQAFTNDNGVIEYSKIDRELDPSQLFKYDEIVSAPESIEIPPNSTENLDIDINVPETKFDGVISGGVRLSVKDVENKENPEQVKGSTVVNKYAYVIGLLLREGDIEQDPEPELSYNKIYAGQSNGRNTIFVNYSNIMPSYLNDMVTEVQISKENSKEVLYETKKSGMRMAPNSYINFPVPMLGSSMEAGNYTAHILITSTTGKWEWNEKFSITKEEADKFNERDVGLEREEGLNWILIAGLVLGIVSIFGIVYFIINLFKKKGKKSKT